jgi:hypothetical protein
LADLKETTEDVTPPIGVVGRRLMKMNSKDSLRKEQIIVESVVASSPSEKKKKFISIIQKSMPIVDQLLTILTNLLA